MSSSIHHSASRDFELPSLCVGKNYHVFIAYSGADREFVLRLVEALESEQYGIKVCFHERDFIPGISTLKNIETAIKQSLKTIIVLSKNFNESEWCVFEAESTVTFGIDSRQSKLLIPLSIDGEEPPFFLRRLDVIQAESLNPSDPWFNSLLGGIQESSHDKDFQQTPILSAGKKYHVSFIYSTSKCDLKWVTNVIRKLTTDPLKYKCFKWPENVYINDIDNLTIQDMENIVRTLENSEKTVIVISEDFMINKVYSFLRNLCKMILQDLKLPGGSLIPVHVDDVQIGNSLGDITYLSASRNIEGLWWCKFLEALLSPGMYSKNVVYRKFIHILK